jgi:extracellular matrix regulatory protein B
LYIHIGEDCLVKAKDIIAIIDKESSNSSPYFEELLNKHENHLIDLAKGSFKSIIITSGTIYFSPLASSTLKKRSEKLSVQDIQS